jgi:peptide/nickel transport system ATP-binding protein/oligopeptide transport system ATP-binding protein
VAFVSAPLLEVSGLDVDFALGRGWSRARRLLHALRGVDLEVPDGRSVGIVGESGCGKSTLARTILGLQAPTRGAIRWRGWTVDPADRSRMRSMRRELQVVFQDPFGSLDPRMTAGDSVAEALEALEGVTEAKARVHRVAAALDEVGLDAGFADRYPHELSGGQCQRVAIARATVVRPRLLICDEAVSALDVSVQAQIVNLLGDLLRRHGTALLFISHNLAVVRHLCDEVVVLYLGRVVERAPREALFAAARHPYTRALIAAVPQPDPRLARPALEHADTPDTRPDATTSTGCAFAPRCPLAIERCSTEVPPLESAGAGHAVACHRWRELAAGS